MPSPDSKFVSVSLPKGITDMIDRILNNEEFGYSSRSEVVKDAVRQLYEKKMLLIKDKDNNK